MSLETAVENEVKAVEAKVETVAQAVEGEAKEAVADVVKEVKAATIAIAVEEKLFLRETELEFLKVQAEIQRLTKIAEEKQKSYTTYVENLFTKYALTKIEYVFDGAVNIFKKL